MKNQVQSIKLISTIFFFFLLSICSQLHLAILHEVPDIASAMIYLAPVPQFLDIKNDDVQAAIHLAALTEQSNIVRRLLIAGATVRFSSYFNFFFRLIFDELIRITKIHLPMPSSN